MTINKCPFDYMTHEKWVKRADKWNKEHPSRVKQIVKEYGLRSRALAAKNKIEKNLE